MEELSKKIRPKFPLIAHWVHDGMSKGQIAKRLGLKKKEFLKLIAECSDLETLMESSDAEFMNAKIEEALFKKANGFSYTETKTVDKGNGEEVTETTKYAAPDMSAISFWLRYMDPKKWDEGKEKGTENEGGVVILPEIVTEG
ncbi:MAG: hypothetical protein E7397_04745 [Ruminococcaceae bacterium]|nr:hypothetical protein [Oscillospiraceae bacterium]